jgi:hypothetical protein
MSLFILYILQLSITKTIIQSIWGEKTLREHLEAYY